MTSAGNPTYFSPSIGWTVQTNTGTGTGPGHMGTVVGQLNFTASTVTAVQQPKTTGGSSGPLSVSTADPAASGAVSVDLEKRYVKGNIPPSHTADAAEGVY